MYRHPSLANHATSTLQEDCSTYQHRSTDESTMCQPVHIHQSNVCSQIHKHQNLEHSHTAPYADASSASHLLHRSYDRSTKPYPFRHLSTRCKVRRSHPHLHTQAFRNRSALHRLDTDHRQSKSSPAPRLSFSLRPYV